MSTDDVVYRRWPPFVALLMISRIQFWFIWISPLVLGYAASSAGGGATHLGWFVVTAVFGCVIESANCIHNELVDEREDVINQPRRVDLLRSVGRRTARAYVVVGYALTVLLIGCIAVFVDGTIALLMAVSAVIAPLYNWGPHFKRHTGLAELAIAVAVILSFTIGWSWNALIGELPAAAWVLGFFFGIMSFVKDLPDEDGDAAVGAAGLLTIGPGGVRRILLGAVYLAPYALIAALVVAGVLPGRFLLLLLLLPTAVWIARACERAATTLHGLIIGYQLAFTYTHLFMVVLLVLVEPGPLTVALAAALFAARLAALAFGLDPRLVEPDFRWRQAARLLL